MEKEKAMAIASLIDKFATSQFQLNQVTPEMAYIIMKFVTEDYAYKCIQSSILNRVNIVNNDYPEHKETDDKE